jgi:hypothetical protein
VILVRYPKAAVVLLVAAVCLAMSESARAADAEPAKVLVVDAESVGVAPESAAAVTRQLYATVARLGYRVVPESTARAASTSPHAGGKSAAELLAAARATHSDHAISATLGALGERYAVSVTLASADGTGPASRTAVTDATSLETEVDSITRSLLPTATTPSEAPEPPEAPKPLEAEKEAESHPPAFVRLSLSTEGAFGFTSGVNESTPNSLPTFYNHIVGPRLDYGFPNDFAVGVFLGYVNLRGKEGRASNLLTYVQLEYRTRVSKSSEFRIPLRLATGYLPKNGPFFRLSAGLEIPLGKGVHLGLDLIAPALWMIRNRTLLSLDVGAEVGFEF